MIERLLQIVEYKGISKRQFYKETGLSNGYLDKDREVGHKKIEIICSTYPDVNPLWLLFGKGEMLLDSGKPNFDLTKDERLEVKSGDPERSLEYFEKFMQEQSETISSYQEQVKDLMLIIKESNYNVSKLVTIVNKQKEELKELREKNNKDSAIG